MINLNLIISFITCLTLNTNTPVKKYSEALNLIINSSKYKSYNVSDENYLVSKEVIAFAEFAINTDVEYSIEVHSLKEIIAKEEKELLKLNKRKRGNVKFSFQKKGIIFFSQRFFIPRKNARLNIRKLQVLARDTFIPLNMKKVW